MKSSSTFFEDWNSLTEGLQQAGIGPRFCWTLKTMLAAARSRNDLHRLHDKVLRSELRLTRPHFVAVEQFWLKHLRQPEGEEAGITLSFEQAFFLLNLDVPTGALGTYYSQQVVAKANKVYHSLADFTYNREGWQIVYSNVGRSGHGDHHYLVTIFGEQFELACWIDPSSRLRVCIQVYGNTLNEQMVYNLTSGLPQYDALCAGFSTDKGSHTDLVFELDGCELVGLLEQSVPQHRHDKPMQIGSAPFFQALINRMVSIGIPLTGAESID